MRKTTEHSRRQFLRRAGAALIVSVTPLAGHAATVKVTLRPDTLAIA